MEEIESISMSISTLLSNGETNAASAFKQLTEALTTASQLNPAVRSDALENLQELALQAALPPSQRARTSTTKALLASLGATLATTANLAQIWSTWGPHIRAVFGL
jgi:hypothetical protein